MRENGFTLIEILLVMTLLVTLSAVLAPMLVPSPGRTLHATASEVATTLREARRQARAQQRRQRFALDTARGLYGLSPATTRRSLPRGVSSELTTGEALLDGDVGGIDFFPDGSSSGGRVRLALEDRAVQVDVEWLTGRIRIAEVTP